VASPLTQNSPDLKAEVEKYRKALAQDPGSRMFAALADALRRSGDIKAAIAVAEDGVNKHPKYLSGIVVLAQAYFADQRFADALELFIKVVKLNPENLLAHRAMAEIYDRLGEHENAVRAYTAITILDHNDKKARERLQILEATMPRTGQSKEGPEPAPREEAPPAREAAPETEPESGEGPAAPEAEKPKEEAVAEPASQPSFPVLPDELVRGDAGPASPGIAFDQEITSPGKPPIEAPLEKPMPPIPPADAGAAAAPAGDEDSMTEELPRPEAPADQPGPSPPAPEPESSMAAPEQRGPEKEAEGKKALSEEEKLDLFFGGADLSELGIAERAAGFEVKKARDALASGKTPAPSVPQVFEIKRSAMARVFWNQGFREKALTVMAGELRERPEDKELRAEFEEACKELGKDSGEVMTEAMSRAGGAKTSDPGAETDGDATTEVEAADPDRQGPKTPAAEAPEQAKEDKEWFLPPAPAPETVSASQAAPEAESVSAPSAPEPAKAVETHAERVNVLKKYLEKIRGGKENKP
jgi:tetratricopeptide (TPR) repeat protein